MGWYAINRGITAHPLFKRNPNRLAVWMWLLDNVAWKDTSHDVRGVTISVPRGSVCASERHIADECGVGYQVVRTAIKRFITEQMINASPTHGKNIITLCNYEKYQDLEKTANATPNAPLTQEQRNANAQKKQENNITRVKKEEPKGSIGQNGQKSTLPILSNGAAVSFDAFWNVVPRKVAKGTAQKAWAKALKVADAETIIDAMQKYADHRSGEDPQYTAHPSSWLNGERWLDAPPEAKKAKTDDFHNQFSQMLGGNDNGLQRKNEVDSERTERLSAPVQAPRSS